MSNAEYNHTEELEYDCYEAMRRCQIAYPDIFPQGMTLEAFDKDMSFLKASKDVMGLPLAHLG